MVFRFLLLLLLVISVPITTVIASKLTKSIVELLTSCCTGMNFECPDFVDPRIFYSGNKLAVAFPFRALKSTPKGFRIQPSSIPNAGLGTFTSIFIKKHTWLGEYEGEFLPANISSNMVVDYVWHIYNHFGAAYLVDARDTRMSNWLRYMNCARNKQELNVKVSQCYGRIYYRTSRDVYPGQELLVYYGNGYARKLGISPFY